MGGCDLPVDVGERHRVAVEQRKASHARAGQSLGGMPAYTAHAEHRRVRARQTLQGLRPQQQLAASEFFPHHFPFLLHKPLKFSIA